MLANIAMAPMGSEETKKQSEISILQSADMNNPGEHVKNARIFLEKYMQNSAIYHYMHHTRGTPRVHSFAELNIQQVRESFPDEWLTSCLRLLKMDFEQAKSMANTLQQMTVKGITFNNNCLYNVDHTILFQGDSDSNNIMYNGANLEYSVDNAKTILYILSEAMKKYLQLPEKDKVHLSCIGTVLGETMPVGKTVPGIQVLKRKYTVPP